LFNRPHPSKRAKSWRAEPGLLSHSSSRGFATTRWGGAEDGFMVDDIKRTKDGFALDEYAQVPLSPQAVQALKRLQAMEPDDNVVIADDVFEAVEAFQIESWNANAHLPFVVDAYAFDDEDLTQNVDHAEASSHVAVEPESASDVAFESDETSVAIEAVATADDAIEALEPNEQMLPDNADVEPPEAQVAQTAEDAQEVLSAADAPVADEATPETDTTNAAEVEVEATAEEKVEAEAKIKAEAEAETEAAAEVPKANPTENQTQDLSAEQIETLSEPEMAESDLADAETVAPEQMAASVDEVVDDVTLPEPVLAGVDPEEVAQREAEKFAEGLAQGIEQGERQAREAMQQEVQAQCTVLANVTQELHALLKDSKAFYEPLKRLAMHLAEQIVKTELKTSTHAIEQLIQSCLAELDHPAQGLVVVELNPDDKNRLQAQSPELIQGMRLEAVQDMQPGSVRLFANDTVIEDLVEHRLDALAQSMLVDVATWKAKSALTKPDASTQDLESEDVHP
jgi:flagellar biosynthesis/type III secretory pathway protein FliH